LEISPELSEVFKMAGLTCLTDHGDLLKKFTVDEIAKMNLATGLEKGREEGREEALLKVARKLLARNTPVADVAELTGLEIAAVENIT
ncbi:MAG: hypothetical protein LBW85_00545, partial [Deltaproteobacteria bacterium]|jgi:predicted transposase/invertase (TIGR01784 family)|nr:hypothetical protein [Deltaproteobacteria bacterium]